MYFLKINLYLKIFIICSIWSFCLWSLYWLKIKNETLNLSTQVSTNNYDFIVSQSIDWVDSSTNPYNDFFSIEKINSLKKFIIH